MSTEPLGVSGGCNTRPQETRVCMHVHVHVHALARSEHMRGAVWGVVYRLVRSAPTGHSSTSQKSWSSYWDFAYPRLVFRRACCILSHRCRFGPRGWHCGRLEDPFESLRDRHPCRRVPIRSRARRMAPTGRRCMTSTRPWMSHGCTAMDCCRCCSTPHTCRGGPDGRRCGLDS